MSFSKDTTTDYTARRTKMELDLNHKSFVIGESALLPELHCLLKSLINPERQLLTFWADDSCSGTAEAEPRPPDSLKAQASSFLHLYQATGIDPGNDITI